MPSRDDLSTGEWMALRILEAKVRDFGLSLPVPSIEEIDKAINDSMQGTALGEYINAAWDAAEEIVYDMFPQFREENFEDEEEPPELVDDDAYDGLFRQEARRIMDYDDGIIWPDDH
jgi:hypothetical protein